MRGEEGRPFREKESQEVRICPWQTGLGLGLLGDHRLAVRRALESGAWSTTDERIYTALDTKQDLDN